jgi:DNA-binding transcriptional ArsR family regulator
MAAAFARRHVEFHLVGEQDQSDLGALSDGEPRMVNEIAKIIGQKPGLVSKHLAVLRGAGLVVLNRRLYQVPAHYIAAADKRHLDFGHCLLRLPDANGQPTL